MGRELKTLAPGLSRLTIHNSQLLALVSFGKSETKRFFW